MAVGDGCDPFFPNVCKHPQDVTTRTADRNPHCDNIDSEVWTQGTGRQQAFVVNRGVLQEQTVS
jgi:hypothetical protein